MTASLPYLLDKHPVFSGLDAAARERLAQEAILKRYRAGETLVHAGDHWPHLFLVAEGSVKILKESSEGRSLIIAEMGAGEIFWGLSFFEEDLPNPVTLQISQPSTLHLWPRQRLLPILLENGALTWELTRQMVKLMLRASEVIEGLAFQPLTGRLARLLLEGFPPDQETVARHLTLDEMAARVGTTREVVCRILYRFAEQGAIRINRTEFVFTDREVLEAHARG